MKKKKKRETQNTKTKSYNFLKDSNIKLVGVFVTIFIVGLGIGLLSTLDVNGNQVRVLESGEATQSHPVGEITGLIDSTTGKIKSDLIPTATASGSGDIFPSGTCVITKVNLCTLAGWTSKTAQVIVSKCADLGFTRQNYYGSAAWEVCEGAIYCCKT